MLNQFDHLNAESAESRLAQVSTLEGNDEEDESLRRADLEPLDGPHDPNEPDYHSVGECEFNEHLHDPE